MSSRSEPPVALHQRALDDLRYIRETMERATAFTALSGQGFVLVGLSAAVAAWVAAAQPTAGRWLAVWMAELLVAGLLAVGMTAMKARALAMPLRSHSGRKLVLAFSPPMAVGALLTLAAVLEGGRDLLPGIWLALYGAGVMTGGAYSVRVVPLAGALFIALGGVALLTPVSGNLMLAVGLGGLHVVLGGVIWRRYGG